MRGLCVYFRQEDNRPRRKAHPLKCRWQGECSTFANHLRKAFYPAHIRERWMIVNWTAYAGWIIAAASNGVYFPEPMTVTFPPIDQDDMSIAQNAGIHTHPSRNRIRQVSWCLQTSMLHQMTQASSRSQEGWLWCRKTFEARSCPPRSWAGISQ